MNEVREGLGIAFGPKACDLKCEMMNYYYDINKCGIGYHGDSERKIVIAIRLGAPLPLHFQWFQGNKPVAGGHITLHLDHGDMYIMSEKATPSACPLR